MRQYEQPSHDERSGTKILVIEDNPADAQLVKEILSDTPATCSYQISVAGTLTDGLQELRDLDADVILLDLSLPDSFGFRTLAALRDADPQTPVVVMTGYGDENIESRALHEGAQGFISKNELDDRLLRRMIRRAIIRKSQENELQITYRFLKITNRHTQLVPLAREFIQEIRAFTGCEAARIRLWDRQGQLHDLASGGFCSESGDCDTCEYIHSNHCHCVRVASGNTMPENVFYTPAGSFYMESRKDAVETGKLDPEQVQHVCLNQPYESVALVPIRCHKQLKGIIHLADFREYMLSVEMVELLEKVAMHLGAALDRIRTEEALSEREVEIFTMFEEAPLPMIAVDNDFSVRSLNNAALTLCEGVYEEHAINHPLGAVLKCRHYSEGGCRKPATPNCVKCPLHQLLTNTFDDPDAHTQRQIALQLERSTEERSRRVIATSCQLQVSGNVLALLYLQDVTHLRMMEEREHAFRAMVDAVGVRMFAVDREEGRFIEMNRALCEELGMAHEDMPHRLYDDIVAQPSWKEITERLKTDDGMPLHLTLQRVDGRSFPLTVFLHAYSHEQQRCIVCIEAAETTG